MSSNLCECISIKKPSTCANFRVHFLATRLCGISTDPWKPNHQCFGMSPFCSQSIYTVTAAPVLFTITRFFPPYKIGSDHRMVMSSIMLNTIPERRKLLNNNTRTRVDTQMIGTKKNTFQLELKNSTRRT